ncbi:MAG: hypothetical protein AAGG75_26525 [Bacteroidota bacterium]
MKFVPLLFFLLLLALTACNNDDDNNTILGQTTDIAFGNGVEIDETGTLLSFIGIEESRCPSSVNCVTPGEAKASFALIGSASILDTIAMVSPGGCFDDDGSCGETKESQGYRIQLLAIQPYPENLITAGPSEYSVKVIVERN